MPVLKVGKHGAGGLAPQQDGGSVLSSARMRSFLHNSRPFLCSPQSRDRPHLLMKGRGRSRSCFRISEYSGWFGGSGGNFSWLTQVAAIFYLPLATSIYAEVTSISVLNAWQHLFFNYFLYFLQQPLSTVYLTTWALFSILFSSGDVISLYSHYLLQVSGQFL